MKKHTTLIAVVWALVLILSGCGAAEDAVLNDTTPIQTGAVNAITETETLSSDEFETTDSVETEKYAENNAPIDNNSIAYIGNINTKKFHNPHCHSVKQMKEKNKKYMTCSRDQAISQGFSPCKNCKP